LLLIVRVNLSEGLAGVPKVEVVLPALQVGELLSVHKISQAYPGVPKNAKKTKEFSLAALAAWRETGIFSQLLTVAARKRLEPGSPT